VIDHKNFDRPPGPNDPQIQAALNRRCDWQARIRIPYANPSAAVAVMPEAAAGTPR